MYLHLFPVHLYWLIIEITNIKELEELVTLLSETATFFFFKNHFRYQYENEHLSVTSTSFWQKILRANCTVFLWKSRHIAKPTLGSPTGHGWSWDDETRNYSPVMATLNPAPESVVELSMYKCLKGCSTLHCKY